MVANRLKNLVKLTREAVKDARQVVEELVNQVNPRPQPALVRVPVRNSVRSNFNSSRSFSTTRTIRSTTRITTPKFNYAFIKRSTQTVNLANKMWPYSAFRRPLAGKGVPSGLYKHFIGTNARNFSTYGGNFSREAVQNLTASLRCFLKNGGDTVLNLNLKSNQSNQLIFPVNSDDDALEIFRLARSESSTIQRNGCFVEFELPSLELPIPSVSFIDSEIVESIEKTFKEMKEQADRVHSNIELIFDCYGSLPIERNARSIKIHFPNLESWEVENLLVDIGIADGIVHSNGYEDYEEISSPSIASSSSITSSTTDLLTTYLNDVAPDLISDSSIDSESLSYYPILSIDSPSTSPNSVHSIEII